MQAHPLIGVIYQPRLAAYSLAATLILSVAVASLQPLLGLWSLLLMAYPFLFQHLLVRRWNHVAGARCSMLVDAALVSLISASVGFLPLPVVTLVTLLLVSALIVGGLVLCCQVLLCYSFVSFVLVSLLPLNEINADTHLINVVSVGLLVVYVAYVAALVFEETRLLKFSRRHETQMRRQLQHQNQRIRPFLAPHVMFQDSPDFSRRRKRLTVFFSDIEGFTRLMDTLDETVIAELLAHYFEAMNRIAVARGGTVDKFIGDGMMVFFGDPVSRGAEIDAYHCVAMAFEMRDAVAQINRRWHRRVPGIQLRVRIGIHTGFSLVGAFGGSERLEYTALGSTVNLASRIEQLAEPGEILLSSQTRQLLAHRALARHRGTRCVKGLSRPVGLYSVQQLKQIDDNSIAEPQFTLLGSRGPV